MSNPSRKSSLRRTQQRMAVLFILPALAVYALFVLYPLAMSLWGSFFVWKGLRMQEFAGLANFSRLFVFPSGARLYGALWHNPGGYAMRELLGGAKAIVPSAKKVGGLGAKIDIPITHINASYVRSHFDAIEIGIGDAPRRDEMVLILAMTTGARVHARVGGLKKEDIKAGDGLR